MKLKKGTIRENELNEKQFRALIENAHEGIVLYDREGKIKYASRPVSKICGLKETEILGKRGTDFIHPDDIDRAQKTFTELLEKPGKSATLFQQIRHGKGHYIWVEARLTNFLHIPELNGIVSNFRDITERKRAEEKEQETRHFLETISRNLSEAIFMGIVGKRFLYVNDAFLKMTGYKLQDLHNLKPVALYADERERRKLVAEIRREKSIKGKEVLFQKKNSGTFWGILGASLLAQDGKEEYFVGTIQDISKEKEAEQERLASRNFLNNILNTVAAPIFVKDAKHRWVMFNDKFAELIGKSRDHLLGKTDKDFLIPEEARVFWQIDDQVLRTGKTVVNEESITSTKKQIHTLLTVKSRYVDEKGKKFIIGFITDITHLKRAEEEIKHLHADLKGILESAKESIFAVDRNLCYTAFNQHHKDIMKRLYGADIRIGENKMQYLKGSSDLKWVKAELRKALQGDHFVSQHYQNFAAYTGYIQTTYNPIRDENNNVKGVAVFVQDITERKRFEAVIKSVNANLRAVMESTADKILAIDKNNRYITFNRSHALNIKELFGTDIKVGDSILEALPPQLSVLNEKKNQKTFKEKQVTIETKISGGNFLETSYNPIYDEKGNVTGNALFIRDTTERKRMEERLKSLNEELMNQNAQLAAQEEELKATLEELSERNFELDQLVYKTSHDLRSPLSSIMGLINLAHLDNDPAHYLTYLDKIEGRIKKLDEFIISMLDYARVNRAEVEPENIDLEALAGSCIRELEYLDNFKSVRTTVKIKNKQILFKNDRLRTEIIFGNIISNAYKYYNPESKSYLQIAISITQRQVKIDFKDNGIGIKPEHLGKIFNMFYRATDRSQGSGLGMYIVKLAVEKLRGTISIRSEYGVGTRIQITLPNRA